MSLGRALSKPQQKSPRGLYSLGHLTHSRLDDILSEDEIGWIKG